MVKATLRTAKAKAPVPPTIDVEAQVTQGDEAELTDMVAGEAGAKAEMKTGAGGKPTPTSPTTAIARRPTMSVARPMEHAEGFDGEWGSDDLRFPTLKLVQGSGPLSAEYDIGTLLYADEELLPPPSKKAGAPVTLLRYVPVAIKKQYREKLSNEAYAEGQMPRVVDTADEVEELNGTINYNIAKNDPEITLWEPSGRCLLLIEAPEDTAHPGFPNQLDGKNYAVALYYAAGSAYRDFCRIIYNTSRISLLVPTVDDKGKPRVGPNGRPLKHPLLYKNFWSLTFTQKTSNKASFTWWSPVTKLIKEETGEEIRNYCADLVRDMAPAAAEVDE